jgi:hypothetical protein
MRVGGFIDKELYTAAFGFVVMCSMQVTSTRNGLEDTIMKTGPVFCSFDHAFLYDKQRTNKCIEILMY